MNNKIDIHKAAAIIIKDKKILITRSRGKSFFISPGGKVEAGETAKEALVRELGEELSIEVSPSDLSEFGVFYASAEGASEKQLMMEVFIVAKWDGLIAPGAEVEEVLWVGSVLPPGLELGSIFKHDVLPKLKVASLID